MADTAAHLVDRVLPEVPVRQWVLSLPFALRYRLAYEAGLVRAVLHIFVQAVFSSLRGRARAHSGVRQAQCGAVTFVQRFGGALNLNVHCLVAHVVGGVVDGPALDSAGLLLDPRGELRGGALDHVAARVVDRILRHLESQACKSGDPFEPRAPPGTAILSRS